MPFGKPPAHVRMTMQGQLGTMEMFSCNLSLKPVLNNLPDPSPDDAVHGIGVISGDKTTRLKDAAVALWANADAAISGYCVLKVVKVAAIDDTGHYSSAPVEFAVTSGGAGNIANTLPFQCSRKITLTTNGDLGRVKGGFYLPAPINSGLDNATQLFSVAATEAVRGAVGSFIEAIEDEDLVDGFRWRVVVASGGRRNLDGTVRRDPTLHDVVGVSVGRRIDIQRRRANKISEAYTAALSV